ncbi:hypothetical protein [Microbacterium elymi]|uniref:Minor tail protein n=1 Tax=Microbacterium elymi TaxID=2909587 RepID=A0ABY5NML2_9MICO|nr:hypothetical protein [Microbacterium elymi]UUT36392.1 hypothetical protein L2X98_26045 [Microbacterium elymi]
MIPSALAATTDPEGLWYIFWWTQNEDISEWLRTVAAALLGALIGGFFTLAGQSRSAKHQSHRDEKAREAAVADARREDTKADVRALFESFIDLERSISDAERTFGQMISQRALVPSLEDDLDKGAPSIAPCSGGIDSRSRDAGGSNAGDLLSQPGA